MVASVTWVIEKEGQPLRNSPSRDHEILGQPAGDIYLDSRNSNERWVEMVPKRRARAVESSYTFHVALSAWWSSCSKSLNIPQLPFPAPMIPHTDSGGVESNALSFWWFLALGVHRNHLTEQKDNRFLLLSVVTWLSHPWTQSRCGYLHKTWYDQASPNLSIARVYVHRLHPIINRY